MNSQHIIRTGDKVLSLDNKRLTVVHLVNSNGQLCLYESVSNIKEVFLFNGNENIKLKINEIKIV